MKNNNSVSTANVTRNASLNFGNKKKSLVEKTEARSSLVRLHLSKKAPEGLTLASVGVGTAPKF